MALSDDEDEFDAPEWVDRTLPADGTAKTVKPKDILMAAARMQRDGRSLRWIKRELDLNMLGAKFIDDRTLQRALDMGHRLLDQAIAKGEEPAESRVRSDDIDTDALDGLWLPKVDLPLRLRQ